MRSPPAWCICRYADADSDVESIPTPVYPASPEATQPAANARRVSEVACRGYAASPSASTGHTDGIAVHTTSEEDVAGPLPTFSARSRCALICPGASPALPLAQHAQRNGRLRMFMESHLWS